MSKSKEDNSDATTTASAESQPTTARHEASVACNDMPKNISSEEASVVTAAAGVLAMAGNSGIPTTGSDICTPTTFAVVKEVESCVVPEDTNQIINRTIKEQRQPVPKLKQNKPCPTKAAKKQSSAARKTAAGRWTREEHEAFLEGLKVHGREWKKVAEKITTRTSAQIRSHAQKYFAKLAKDGSLLQHGGDGIMGSCGDMENLGCEMNNSYLSSSVLSKIDKITKDPSLVQHEVETTLKMLQERYRQLQIQLQLAQQKQAERHQKNQGSQGSQVNPGKQDHARSTRSTPDVESDVGPATAMLAAQQNELDLDAASSFMPVVSFPEGASKSSDESLSSEDSTRSELKECSNRGLVNEELIALEVLGGGLPSRKRKESPTVSPGVKQQEVKKKRSQPS